MWDLWHKAWHADVVLGALELIQGRPTLGLKRGAQFKSCGARQMPLRTVKGKRAAEATPNPNPNGASIGIILSFDGEDSAASFHGADVLST